MFLCMALALAVYYSSNEVRFAGTFNPQGSLEAYEAKLAETPSMTCECKNQAVPMGEYTTTNLEMSPSCDWFKKDMEVYESDPTKSSCKIWGQSGYCRGVEKACAQSETVLNWMKKELKDKVIFSTQLMAEDSLLGALNNTFDGLYQIATVISTASLDMVESWAASNMPKVHKMLGGITGRVRALTKKQLHDLHDDYRDDFGTTTSADGTSLIPGSTLWNEFKTKCEAAEPLFCPALWESNPLLAYEGDKNTCPVLGTVYPSYSNERCKASWVGDGLCDKYCMSEACLFDGGDCGGKDLNADPWGEKSTETAFTTSDAALREGFLTQEDLQAVPPKYDLHWLDTPDDYYLNSTKRRCDTAEFWTKIGWLPFEDDAAYQWFAGYDWSTTYQEYFVNNGRTPPASVFRASMSLGCDAFKKDLAQNFFRFNPLDEAKTFFSEWIAGLEKVQDEDGVDLSPEINLMKTAGDFLLNGTGPMTEYFGDLETAIKELFVGWNQSNVTLDYEKYFNACAPTTCSYVYQDTPSSAAIVSVVFGLIGGISAAMDSIFMVIYKVCKKIIIGPSVDDESPASKGDTKTRKVKPEAAKGKADKKTEKKAEKKKEDAVLDDADEEEDEEDEEEEDVEVLVQK